MEEYTPAANMTATKRPSTSSLRRFINSRPYVALSEIRRRFGLEETDEVTRVTRNGTTAFVGLPEREAVKIAELWQRGEIGLELSVEVRAPAVVGVYPMRVARYVHNPSGGAPRNRAPGGTGLPNEVVRTNGAAAPSGLRPSGPSGARPNGGAPPGARNDPGSPAAAAEAPRLPQEPTRPPR